MPDFLWGNSANLCVRISGDDGQLYHEGCALPRSIHGVYATAVAFKYGAAYAQP